MSTQEYNKKIELNRKALGRLKKDIQYRDEQVQNNMPTHTLDAEIRAQFTQINQDLEEINSQLTTFQKKPSEFNLLPRDIDKKRKAYKVNEEERDKLKILYETYLTKKAPNTMAARTAENTNKFNQKYEGKKLTKEDHIKLKKKQEEEQDAHLDNLIGNVKLMKNGQKNIENELKVHDGLLNKLDQGMDENTGDMSKIRRNMVKLLEKSGYTCLILVILIQIAGIVVNLLLWQIK